MSSSIKKLFLLCVIVCGFSSSLLANNLTVSNVSFGSRDPGAKTLVINFDMSWENSWRNKINHDGVWVTVRLNKTIQSPTYKRLCQISNAGLNPAGSSVGTNKKLELYVPSDKTGFIVRRNANDNLGNIATTNASVTVKYDSCGLDDNDQVVASVFGLEVVFVPQGFFYAGDNNTSTASLYRGSADSRPWIINSENQISVTNAINNGYRYVSAGNAGEYATGSSFSIPANFPKGYNSFYVMKYEITEGQWVEFFNSLPSDAARASHDVTDNNHKNSDSVVKRNTIACSGVPLTCSTTRPQRAASFLSWGDLTAFLDWAALRPMTELEFEKLARGPVLSNNGEYPWGNQTIAPASTISGSEDGAESISNEGANAHFNSTSLSGGDASNGADNQQGPLRVGIFATDSSTRQSAGASYYGIMDVAGNLQEHVVSIGNATGLAFTGLHGDGSLSTVSGFEGNANVSNWPGMDTIVDRGITGSLGSGFRGGSWSSSADALRISDRSKAALSSAVASQDNGGRGVRTYDGN